MHASTSERRQPAGERADPARRRGERGGLAADGGEVVVAAAADLEGGAHLGHLALAQTTQGVGEQRGHLGAQARRDGGAARQEVVAGHDGHQIPEATVDALHVAPDRRLVDHVVVVQRGQVHELDRDGSHQVVLGGVALSRRGAGEREQRPEPLAAGRDQVGGHFVQEAVARDHRGGEQGLQTPQALLQAGEAQGLGRIHASDVRARPPNLDNLLLAGVAGKHLHKVSLVTASASWLRRVHLRPQVH